MTNIHLAKQQSGAALVIGLIILLVMTLLGVSSMNSSRLELKISANVQNKSISFQTAEAALQQVVTSTHTDWSNIITADTYNYAIADKKYSASTVMSLEDCRKNPLNYDLTGAGIGDGKGGNFKQIVHNFKSTGIVTTKLLGAGKVISSSNVTAGIATVLAGCTPPVAAPTI